MLRAMELAKMAEDAGEVPVGAVVVKDGLIIGEGFNSPISTNDASAHAEIQAIRAACQFKENYRLPNCSLYVTLEPCAMCAGAMVHARISNVFIATREPRAGAAGSAMDVLQHLKLNHQCDVKFGLMEQQSSTLLKQFFKRRR
jgi:tRNA(adenine34) deaminase